MSKSLERDFSIRCDGKRLYDFQTVLLIRIDPATSERAQLKEFCATYYFICAEHDIAYSKNDIRRCSASEGTAAGENTANPDAQDNDNADDEKDNSDEDEDKGEVAGDAEGEGHEVKKQRNAAFLEKVNRSEAEIQTSKAKRFVRKFERAQALVRRDPEREYKPTLILGPSKGLGVWKGEKRA